MCEFDPMHCDCHEWAPPPREPSRSGMKEHRYDCKVFRANRAPNEAYHCTCRPIATGTEEEGK